MFLTKLGIVLWIQDGEAQVKHDKRKMDGNWAMTKDAYLEYKLSWRGSSVKMIQNVLAFLEQQEAMLSFHLKVAKDLSHFVW